MYSLAWLLASMALSLVVGLLAGTLGLAVAHHLVVPALVLALSSAFYVSLWFSFVDNFGSPDDQSPSCRRPNRQPCRGPEPARRYRLTSGSGLQPAPALAGAGPSQA